MTSRERRRAALKRLINRHRISSQEELVGLLAAEGITCTQATLSRDLRDMGVARRNTIDGPVYSADHDAAYIKALRRVVSMEIRRVQHNGSLVVIRTLSGRAEGVAAYLDGWGHSNLLGTVAGDDTVFVAPVNTSKIEALARDIRKLETLPEED